MIDNGYKEIARGILKGKKIELGFVDEKEMTEILVTLAKEYYNACSECKTFEEMQEKYPVIYPVLYNSTPKVESLETDWEIYAKLTINGKKYGVRIENNYKWEQFVTFKSEESNEKLSSFKIYGKNAHNVFEGEKSILPVEGQKDMKKLISEYLCKNTEIANRVFQGENVDISIKDSTEGVVVNAKNIAEARDIVETILEKARTIFYEGDDLVFVPKHDYKFTINEKILDIDYSENYGIGYWDEPTTELVITSEEFVVVKDVIGGEDGYDEEVEDEFPCMEISYDFDNDDWDTKFPKLVESIINYAYKEELEISEKILKGEKVDLSNYDDPTVRRIIEGIYDKAIEAIYADTGDKLKDYDYIHHKEFIVNGKEICLQYTNVDSGDYYEPPTPVIRFFSAEFTKPIEFGDYGEYYEEPCMEDGINIDDGYIDDKSFIDTIMDYAYNEGRFKKNIEDTLSPPNSKNNKIQKEL